MRAHNFGAGPCTLPVEVLEEARDELLDFAGSGMSVVELSHRSPTYQEVHSRALDLTRRVAEVPDDFEVLFVQGGATLQFAMVPLNLVADGQRAAYVDSGSWGSRAMEDAARHGDVYAAWSGREEGYRRMPRPGELKVGEGTRYLHVTTNETIGGIRMVAFPEPRIPLVADMSSEYLARPIEWHRFDLVYGGVQKNLAPAGMAVVFARRSAIEAEPRPLASYLRYRWHAENESLGNTPAMFTTYVMSKVLERIEAQGGIPALEKASAVKAATLYRVIDESEGFYRNPVEPEDRSHMNVVFRLPSPELEAELLAEAKRRHMVGLKGHRSVGGCRASLYAALEQSSVDALADLMAEFADSHR